MFSKLHTLHFHGCYQTRKSRFFKCLPHFISVKTFSTEKFENNSLKKNKQNFYQKNEIRHQNHAIQNARLILIFKKLQMSGGRIR